MTFYERYEKLAVDAGIKPISEEAAKKIGVTRSAISIWKKNGKTPLPETVKQVAIAYDCSPDYLLGLSDDPTPKMPEDLSLKAPESALNQSVLKSDPIYKLVDKLDDVDRIKAEAYLEGLLAADKYKKKMQA